MGVLLAAAGLAACSSAPSPAATLPAAVATALPTVQATAPPAAAGPVVFAIVPGESRAAFSLTELLRGQPKTVVGETSQVAGQITLDLADLAQSQVGPIEVTVGSLATDSGFRDRAIRDFILNTGQYPSVTFRPTSLSGLSGAGRTGQTLAFEITGDLTIRDVSRPVTFAVTAQGTSPKRITGTATATLRRSDYSLQIPSVPQVADVSDNVVVTLDFVAQAAN